TRAPARPTTLRVDQALVILLRACPAAPTDVGARRAHNHVIPSGATTRRREAMQSRPGSVPRTTREPPRGCPLRSQATLPMRVNLCGVTPSLPTAPAPGNTPHADRALRLPARWPRAALVRTGATFPAGDTAA